MCMCVHVCADEPVCVCHHQQKEGVILYKGSKVCVCVNVCVCVCVYVGVCMWMCAFVPKCR